MVGQLLLFFKIKMLTKLLLLLLLLLLMMMMTTTMTMTMTMTMMIFILNCHIFNYFDGKGCVLRVKLAIFLDKINIRQIYTLPVITPMVNPNCKTLFINEHRMRPKAATAPPTAATARCPYSLLRNPASGPGYEGKKKTNTE